MSRRATHRAFVEPSSASACLSLTWRCVLAVLPLMLAPLPAAAEGRSHAYVSAGVGATDIDAGLDWLIVNGPLGVGAEIGVGNLLVASLTASYHPLARRQGRFDPFATVSLTGVNDLNSGATGASVGGGVIYWARARVGIRFDGFAFRPIRGDLRETSVGTSPHYWGLRVGLAIGFR